MRRSAQAIVILVGCFVVAGQAAPAAAQEPFNLFATTGGYSSSQGYTSIEELFDALLSENLAELLPTYTEGSAASLTLDIRGLDAMVAYEAGSTAIRFTVPYLGIDLSFDEGSRDASEEALEEYIKQNGEGILTAMLQALVATTPNDPVAGNPNSMMGRAVNSGFEMGSDVFRTAGATPIQKSSDLQQNQFGMGVHAAAFSAGGLDQNTLVVPITYTNYFDSDPRRQFRLDIPLVYTDTSGADSYSLAVGMGWRLPVSDDWSLTPGLRFAAAGSEDLGAAAVVLSGTLASNLNFYFGDLIFTVGDMVGYMTTQSLDADEYEVDYDLSNPMTKNGVALEGSLGGHWFGEPTSWKASLAHTAVFGDEWFVDSYFDAAVSFGTRKREGVDKWTDLRLGLTYTFGADDFDGLKLNFGYAF